MDAKPKNRRFRFSLRTLLVLVTIAGTGFGWLGVKVRAKQREREAVRAVHEVGGDTAFDYQMAHDDPFAAPPDPPGPLWLRQLIGDDFFADISHVSLLRGATDNDLRRLEDFPRLKTLVLFGSREVTDAGITHLKNLIDLEKLNLSGTFMTDAGLAELKGLNRLEVLNLSDTQVTDAGLVHLAGKDRLRWLSVTGTGVTDAKLKELQMARPNLEIAGMSPLTD